MYGDQSWEFVCGCQSSKRGLGGNTCPLYTVEPRFNKPLYTKVLGITNDFLQLGQNYNKMCGTETRYNEPWFNESRKANIKYALT